MSSASHKTKTLIIVDVQNDYFPNGTMTLVNAEQASLNAQRLLAHFREQKLPIIHIQHIATNPAATFFLPNTAGADIHPHVSPQDNERWIVKHFPNSFRETSLLADLQKIPSHDLVICGMMTHMCIDATVRAAKDLGFQIELISDACATKDLAIHGETVPAAAVQTAFLAALAFFYADVVTTQDYLAR